MSAWNDDRNFEESINTDQFLKEISQNLLENYNSNNTVNAPHNFTQQSKPLNRHSHFRNSERQQPQQQQQHSYDHQKSKVNINHFKRMVQNTTQFNKSIDRSLLSESRMATDRKIEDDRKIEGMPNDFQRFVALNQIPTKGRGSPIGRMRSSDFYPSAGNETHPKPTENEISSDQKSSHQSYLSRQSIFSPLSSPDFHKPPTHNHFYLPQAVSQERPKIAQQSYIHRDSHANTMPLQPPAPRFMRSDDKFDKYTTTNNNKNYNMKPMPSPSWPNGVQRYPVFDHNREVNGSVNAVKQPLGQQYGKFENQPLVSNTVSMNKSMESIKMPQDVNGNFSHVQTRQNYDTKLPNARPLSHGYYEVYLCGETRNDAIANRIEKTVRNTECPPRF